MTTLHKPERASVHSCGDGCTRFAMCANCGQGLESWLTHDDDTGYTWSRFGVFTGCASTGYLDTTCPSTTTKENE